MGLKSKRTARIGLLAISFALFMAASSVNAATLNVVGGQLLGASGVIVDGAYYDVEFLDGTCIDLYNGCDAVSDFTFQTKATATLASQALLDQVFLDAAQFFDTNPTLTNGIASPAASAFILVPFIFNTTAFVGAVMTSNRPTAETDFVSALVPVFMRTDDFGMDNSRVYAVWTPVPEPTTALLMGLGLLGLGMRPSRRRQA